VGVRVGESGKLRWSPARHVDQEEKNIGDSTREKLDPFEMKRES
jgi:hypothetical protein